MQSQTAPVEAGSSENLSTLTGYKTKQELAYDALREAIITCRFPPGKRLLEIELSQQLGMSRSPVREALKRLSHEGLVTEIPHIGATVSEVALESLHELYLILAALEGLACREATPHCTTATLEAAEGELSAMEHAIAVDDYMAWVRHNRQFHFMCRKDSALPQLQRMLEDAQNQLHRFQIFRGAATTRAKQTQAEHIAILAAIKAGDGELAEQLVRAHYLEGDRSFKEYLRTMSEAQA